MMRQQECPRSAGTLGGRTRKVSSMPEQSVEPGYCQCGCGAWIGFHSKTSKRDGAVRGAPKRFKRGHHSNRPVLPRLIENIDFSGPPEGCWVWTAGFNRYGYGTMSVRHKKRMAHRLTYELLIGFIPDGFDLDHLCRNTRCVNPAHLEPVTHGENVRRGAGAKMTWEAVTVLRRAHSRGQGCRELARQFGVSKTTVQDVANGSRWPESARPKEGRAR